MQKFVSFRLAKSTMTGIVNQYNHDKRTHSPKYVNASKSSQNETLFVSEAFKSLESKGLSPKTLFKEYNDLQRVRIKEKTGRKAQASAEFFNVGILTFSNSMAEDYKDNAETFKSLTRSFLSNLEYEFGFSVLTAELHLDETVPHVHLTFDNIGANGKGIRRKITPKVLTAIQTSMGEFYERMGYERGTSKTLTNRKHLSVSELHQANEIYDRLTDEILELKDEQRVKENIIRALADESPKMVYITEWIKGNVYFEELTEQEQTNVKKYINNTNDHAPEPER